MQISNAPILLVALVVGILSLSAIVVGIRMRPAKHSHIAVAIAILPSLLMLILFYSLAIHMHMSLGAWPTSIGERGFPATLITHGYIATNYFSMLLLVSFIVWLPTSLLCLLARRLRVVCYYLAVYALACLACFGAMLLAPSQFLSGWCD